MLKGWCGGLGARAVVSIKSHMTRQQRRWLAVWCDFREPETSLHPPLLLSQTSPRPRTGIRWHHGSSVAPLISSKAYLSIKVRCPWRVCWEELCLSRPLKLGERETLRIPGRKEDKGPAVEMEQRHSAGAVGRQGEGGGQGTGF